MENVFSEKTRMQYQNADNLNRRISIHDKYSMNKQGFGPWIFEHYELKPGYRILELGCGTGEMWKHGAQKLPVGCEVYLTDYSEGMLKTAQENLPPYENFHFQIVDIQHIPFEAESFDALIANMMLYHVPDIERGLSEAHRVLKKGGTFYCATYGEHGIVEYLSGLLESFGLKDPLNKRFTLQNGEAILKRYFASVRREDYPDALLVTDPVDLVDYLYSMASMTGLNPDDRERIEETLRQKMNNGVLTVPKEYGMFICE